MKQKTKNIIVVVVGLVLVLANLSFVTTIFPTLFKCVCPPDSIGCAWCQPGYAYPSIFYPSLAAVILLIAGAFILIYGIYWCKNKVGD